MTNCYECKKSFKAVYELKCQKCDNILHDNEKYYCIWHECCEKTKFFRKYDTSTKLFDKVNFALCDKCNKEIENKNDKEKIKILVNMFMKGINDKLCVIK